MPHIEEDQRAAVVAEAMNWLNTPYHHQGNVLGAGVDCAYLLIRVYHAVGLIPDIDPRPYPMDWHLHRGEERYLSWVEQYAMPVTEPLHGDIVLFQFGRCISHGAIVIDWPLVAHAWRQEGAVVLTDVTKTPALRDRLAGFYSLWRR